MNQADRSRAAMQTAADGARRAKDTAFSVALYAFILGAIFGVIWASIVLGVWR